MRRSLLCSSVLLLALAGCDVQVDVGDGGAGGGGGGAGGGQSSWAPCTAAAPCPAGQFCFNGLCALGCQSNGNCAADQYCDTQGDLLCHNKVVPTCVDAAGCASSQTCIGGLCSTPPPTTSCNPDAVASGNDGCTATTLCVDPLETSAADPRCYSFPACAQDATCPVGLQGAVCNDGLIPNKARICLTGLCRSEAQCPARWLCFKFTANDVLGNCSSKGPGSPCHTSADCTGGNCNVFAPGFPGVCL